MATPDLDSLCFNISHLQQLARQGSWRSLIDTINQARKLSLPQFPHEQLVYHAYLVLSFIKLRKYGDASNEMDSLADLDSPQYQFQHYPSLYPGRTGSMVPFVLRWLHAELPHRLGQTSVTMERLYALFDRCKGRIERLQGTLNTTDLAKTMTENEQFQVPGNESGSQLPSEAPASNPPSENELVESPDPGMSPIDPDAACDGEGETNSKSVGEPTLKDANTNLVEDIVDGMKSMDPYSKDAKEETDSSRSTEENGMMEGMSSSSVDVGKSLVEQPGASESNLEFGEFVTGMAAAGDDLSDKPRDKDVDGTSASAANSLRRWQHRQEIVMNSILSHHLNQKDFVVVLKWFKQLLLKHPSDVQLLSKLGYVQMQFGDLIGAKNTFLKVEDMVSHTTVGNSLQSSFLKGLVCRNRGLQHTVLKQYSEAIKEFDAAMELNPVDIISANNKALCCMYSRDLVGSTKVLESVLDKVPLMALNESLVLNLCSMYELAFVKNVQTKKTLSDWILQVAPDDFDLSCTRL